MGLQIEVTATNAAFYVDEETDGEETQSYSPGGELARILRVVADRIDGQALDDVEGVAYVLHDESGNKVGMAQWESDDEAEDDEQLDEDEDDDDED